VERAAAIAATPGVDVVWIGEFDLSVSLGVPGDLGHKLVTEAEKQILRVCADAGVVAGVLAADAQAARAKLDQGFRMVALGTDISLYGQALRGALAALRVPAPPSDSSSLRSRE
jgi:2-keto-3-deoxy-L-rhamnonate aldolase RhmA